jgi:hypothetical protein
MGISLGSASLGPLQRALLRVKTAKATDGIRPPGRTNPKIAGWRRFGELNNWASSSSTRMAGAPECACERGNRRTLRIWRLGAGEKQVQELYRTFDAYLDSQYC